MNPSKPNHEELTGAHILMRTLRELGVSVIFGYPGGAIMPIYDALYDYEKDIHHVLVRHEQGAAHAAEGYARATGEVGVAFATSGPGATNLVTGIADAMMDSVPIVCITGQVASTLLGSDAFQEVDIIGITTPVTKWNYQVTDAGEIAEVVKKAFHIAKHGRPGPVLIDITKDAQFAKTSYSPSPLVNIPGFKPTIHPNPHQIQNAAAILNKAERPLILAGHGVLIAQASPELAELAHTGDIPIAVTLHGISSIPVNDTHYVGWLGMHGNYGPNMLTNQADVICAVGMRFDDRVTGRLKDYAPRAKVIHIDIDPAELNKNVKAIVPIVADVKHALQALIPHITPQNREGWRKRFHDYYELEYSQVVYTEVHPKGNKILMAEFIKKLSDATNGDAVIVADVGQHQMKTARYYEFATHNSFFSSGGMGTMGFALPAAIGAQFGTNRTVVSIMGDGSFQMNLQELATIAQEDIPVKIVILNNGFLGMVRQWQELFFEKRYSFTTMKNPDFVKLAEGFRIPAKRITKREDVMNSVAQMISSKGPYLLDVMVAREENVFPMIPTGASVEEVRLK